MNVDSAVVIEIGDLLWLNTDDVRNAAAYTWDTNYGKTQNQIKTRFFGVAEQASPSGTTGEIRCGTAGVFEFTCVSNTFNVGDLVAVNDDNDCAGAGTVLVDQEVIKTTDPRRAIGRVAKQITTAATTVLVEIMPQAAGNGGGLPKIESLVLTGDGVVSGAADIVTAFIFGRRIKIIRAWAVTTVAVTTASATLTLTTTGGAIDDTLVITTGAMGEFHAAEISDAAGDDFMEEDDVLGVASDGGSDAGAVTFGVDFYEVGAGV